jgi:succinate dehydrogenase/fumarate reductase flavoprotein subunit
MPNSASYDLIVLGAGAAGMTSACVAAAEGLKVLLVEKAPQVGGTTAWSGGMVWAPANRQMARAGRTDTLEAARTYLAQTVPGSFGAARREAFLAHAADAIDYLEQRTPLRMQPVQTYPDYYPDLPGATAGGRVLEPVPFDARRLGPAFALLRPPLPEFTLLGGMMVSRQDIPHFRRFGRSAASTWRVAKLVAAYARQRLSAPRGTTLYLGNALAGRLLLGVRELGVELALETTAERLTGSPGQIDGVVLRGRDGTAEIRAGSGVVLAAGGFSHDPALRAQYLPDGAGTLSAASPYDTGDGLRLGLAAGGKVGPAGRNGAFWVPASRFTRPDGTEAVFPHTVTDRAKPGVIAVDRTGRRFVNEARSYHDFVLAMLERGNTPRDPAWLVCDRRFLRSYGLGRVRPFALSLREPLASGYLVSASTPQDLAGRIGVDADGLTATLSAYNAEARNGRDPEFDRGGDIYQRHLGDGAHQPNPCVAPIEQPPYYAVAVHPADLGTALGLATDAHARVLGADDRPIAGLYCCGNDMDSIMNGAYPGPGITLGPALVFGYLAARHAAGG